MTNRIIYIVEHLSTKLLLITKGKSNFSVRYYLQPPEWLKLKRLRITSIGEKAEQIEHFSWECKMA